LVRLRALRVHLPAVAQYFTIGRDPLGGHTGQQAGLEPAAELVGAFHIQIHRPGQFRAFPADRAPGGAGIEPDVHDIGIFLPVRSAALADFGFGHDLVGIILVPGIAALLAEQVRDSLDGSIGDMVFAALFAVEHRDRHAPDALAADAPVAAVAHHARHTVMAPRRLPVHAVGGFVDIFLEGVDGTEPLLRSTEDDGVVAAPEIGRAHV